MSQHDMNIANQGFPAFRSDLNNALTALASNSSGDAEPSTTFANQFWYETDTNLLKFRNEDNDAWITLAYFDQANNEWQVRSPVIQAVGSGGLQLRTDEGTTRIDIQDDGDVSIDSGTLFVDAGSNLVGVGTTSPVAKITSSGSNHPARFGDDGTGFNLDVKHDTTNGITSLEQTNSGGDIRIKAGHTSGKLKVETGGAERLTITQSGHIGVANTSPSAFGSGQTTLEVKGNSSSYPNRGGIFASVTQDGGTGAYFGVRADDIPFVGASTGSAVELWPNNQRRAVLTTNGDFQVNRGFLFGHNSSGSMVSGDSIGYMAAARDNSASQGITLFITDSGLEWQPIGGKVFVTFGRTGLQAQASTLFRWNAQLFNGSLQGVSVTTVSGGTATLSISDLGDSGNEMEIRLLATASGYDRIAVTAWGACYPHVLATQRT